MKMQQAKSMFFMERNYVTFV